jgi:tRNA pseudouridine38/39 synthase
VGRNSIFLFNENEAPHTYIDTSGLLWYMRTYDLTHDMPYDTSSYGPGILNRVYAQVEQQWELAAIRTAILRNQLETLRDMYVRQDHCLGEIRRKHKGLALKDIHQWTRSSDVMIAFARIWPYLPYAGKSVKHIPLMRRKTGYSVEEKMDSVQRKQNAKGNIEST